jgi:hypothetical protein
MHQLAKNLPARFNEVGERRTNEYLKFFLQRRPRPSLAWPAAVNELILFPASQGGPAMTGNRPTLRALPLDRLWSLVDLREISPDARQFGARCFYSGAVGALLLLNRLFNLDRPAQGHPQAVDLLAQWRHECLAAGCRPDLAPRLGSRPQRWHDRGIGDAQPGQAADTKLVVDHRHRVVSHLAGADRMVAGLGIVPDPVEQLVVGVDAHARRDLVGGDVLHGRRRHDAPGDAHRFQGHRALLKMGHIAAGMEYFPAIDEEQFKFIQKLIDDCDYYVVIVGNRYAFRKLGLIEVSTRTQKSGFPGVDFERTIWEATDLGRDFLAKKHLPASIIEEILDDGT